jgi:hypothetical protein
MLLGSSTSKKLQHQQQQQQQQQHEVIKIFIECIGLTRTHACPHMTSHSCPIISHSHSFFAVVLLANKNIFTN